MLARLSASFPRPKLQDPNNRALAGCRKSPITRTFERVFQEARSTTARILGPGGVSPDGRIALLQRNGRFVLRSLSGDKVLARTRLEPDEQLSGLRLVRFGPQYLVFAETTLPEVDSQRTIRPGHQVNAALVTARLYSFDAQTGRNLWPR